MFPIDQSILEAIGKELKRKEQTIAVAESVTCGLIQHAIGSIKDATQFYHGGITAYNIAQKFHHLCVDPLLAEKCNAVSSQVAEQMAQGVSRLFHSHWGIGITGYATPVPESGNRLYAYYAISYRGDIQSGNIILHTDSQTSAVQDVQLAYSHRVLTDFRQVLQQGL